MAVGTYILSQKRRETLAVFFVTLCVLQIIIGCGMTGSSLYIIITVAPVLHAEKSEVNFVFVVTGIYGTHVIFHWIIGINICQKCLKQASRRSTSNLFILWTCMGTNTILQLLVLSHFAKKMNRYISRSMKQSVTTGMNQYLEDLSWKETIDKLQYSNECCGLTSYDDWHQIKWLTKYHVDLKSELIKKLKTGNEVLTLPVTPWSCCKIDFPMQCLHDPVQQAEYSHIWIDEPNIVADSINTQGCLDILRKPIDWVLKLFVVSSSFLCILHIILFFISRILYTSARNAILLGNPAGSAPGWILGRGDCGYSGGKSVIEIMEAHPELATETDITEDEETTVPTEQEPESEETPSEGFFKRKLRSFKRKEAKKTEDEDIPLIESINEKKINSSQVRPSKVRNTKSEGVNKKQAEAIHKDGKIREKSKTEVKQPQTKGGKSKTEVKKPETKGEKSKTEVSKKQSQIQAENEKSKTEIGKKQPQTKEKSKTEVDKKQPQAKGGREDPKPLPPSPPTRKKKNSPRSTGPSSEGDSGKNSVAEEIKRLQQ